MLVSKQKRSKLSPSILAKLYSNDLANSTNWRTKLKRSRLNEVSRFIVANYLSWGYRICADYSNPNQDVLYLVTTKTIKNKTYLKDIKKLFSTKED